MVMVNNRVLIITSSLAGGGAENHILNLCRYLKKTSFSATVMTISPEKDELENALRVEGVSIRYFPISSLMDLLMPGRIFSLRRVIREIDPDIIHAHLYHGEVVAAVASLFTKAPLVVTRHGSGLEFEGGKKRVIRAIRSRIDRIIAVSEEGASEAVQSGFQENMVLTIPSGVDTDRFTPASDSERGRRKAAWLSDLFTNGIEGNELVIGTLGGMRKVKNHSLFLQMAARLEDGYAASGLTYGQGASRLACSACESSPEDMCREPEVADDRCAERVTFRFVILGDGPERSGLENLSERLGLNACLSMPGFCAEPEKVLPLFDIFVLPSLTEGVPVALLEAMSCGLPCIASDVGGVPDLLSGTGIIVQGGNVKGFAAAAESFIDDEQKRSDFGRMARERIISQYDITSLGGGILEVFNKLLDVQKVKI